MRCKECGAENPPEARYCFQCGTKYDALLQRNAVLKQTHAFCLKCGIENHPDSEFCVECGTSLAKKAISKTNICPTCRIPLDTSYYFCHNCGQTIGSQNEKTHTDTQIVEISSSVCPSCGQKTTGEFCQECGFHVKSRQSALDWWYCSRESAIMQEMDSKTQFLIPRESLDESVALFQKEGNFPSHQREMITKLSKFVFSQDPTSNFCSITKVKCPICGQTSYASINIKPQPSQLLGTGKKTLNGSVFIRSGIFYLKNHKEFYFIIIFGILADLVSSFLGFGNLAAFDAISSILVDFDPTVLNQSLFTFELEAILLDFILTSFLLSWTLTSLRQVQSEGRSSIDLISSAVSTVRHFPSVLILQVFSVGVSLLGVFSLGLLDVSYFNSGSVYQSTSSLLPIFLIALIFMLVLAVVEFTITILTAYFLPAFFFDSKRSIKGSVRNGYKFARKYFWLTLGMIVFFNVISNISSYFAIPSLFIDTLFLPLLITSFVIRSVAVYRILSFGWAYDEFKDEPKK